MKNIFKISTVFLLALLFTVSSCKKEDEVPVINGCTYSTASNYNPSATFDDGSCIYDVFGCTYPTASNYNPLATIDDGSCILAILVLRLPTEILVIFKLIQVCEVTYKETVE